MPQAVLLDRDGVINADSPNYILTPEQWQPIPGSLEAIARLHQAGIAIAVVSNQSARGRGMLDAVTFTAIHDKMLRAISSAGGALQHTAYCPHAPAANCDCRKPRPGLVKQALHACCVRAEQAVMIGDSLRDVQAALAAGVRPILVESGYTDATAVAKEARALCPGLEVYPDLAAAVACLLD